MKKTTLTLLAALFAATLHAAPVAYRWTAETADAKPYAVDIWRGETVDLIATVRSYGALVDFGAAEATLYWQASGMGASWWSAPAKISGPTITATWSPEYDSGAASYTFYLAAKTKEGTSYRVNGTLKMKASPGFNPAELPPPDVLNEYAKKSWIEEQGYFKGETDPTIYAWAKSPTPPPERDPTVPAATNALMVAVTGTLAETLTRDGSTTMTSGSILRALNKGTATGGFSIHDQEKNLSDDYTAFTRRGFTNRTGGVSDNYLLDADPLYQIARMKDIPAVPAWALEPNPPAAGVTSVNGVTGDVDIFTTGATGVRAIKNNSIHSDSININPYRSGTYYNEIQSTTVGVAATENTQTTSYGYSARAVGNIATVLGWGSLGTNYTAVVGGGAFASAPYNSTFGYYASSGAGAYSISIGANAKITGTETNRVQIGRGAHSGSANTMNIWKYPFFDGNTGKIFSDRVDLNNGFRMATSNYFSEVVPSQYQVLNLNTSQSIGLSPEGGVQIEKADDSTGLSILSGNSLGSTKVSYLRDKITYTETPGGANVTETYLLGADPVNQIARKKDIPAVPAWALEPNPPAAGASVSDAQGVFEGGNLNSKGNITLVKNSDSTRIYNHARIELETKEEGGVLATASWTGFKHEYDGAFAEFSSLGVYANDDWYTFTPGDSNQIMRRSETVTVDGATTATTLILVAPDGKRWQLTATPLN